MTIISKLKDKDERQRLISTPPRSHQRAINQCSVLSPVRSPHFAVANEYEGFDQPVNAENESKERFIRIIKYTVSFCFMAFCLIFITRGIFRRETPVAMGAGPIVAFCVMWFLIAWLGMLEGGQGSLVGLQPINRELYRGTHKSAYQCTGLVYEGDNLNRFIVGRQFLVVLVVFCLNLVCTPLEGPPVPLAAVGHALVPPMEDALGPQRGFGPGHREDGPLPPPPGGPGRPGPGPLEDGPLPPPPGGPGRPGPGPLEDGPLPPPPGGPGRPGPGPLEDGPLPPPPGGPGRPGPGPLEDGPLPPPPGGPGRPGPGPLEDGPLPPPPGGPGRPGPGPLEDGPLPPLGHGRKLLIEDDPVPPAEDGPGPPPEKGFIESFLVSGLPVMLITVILGQLAAEVNATNCMLDFINSKLMVVTTWICLAIEASGLLHATYLVSVLFTAFDKTEASSSDAQPTKTSYEQIGFWSRTVLSTLILAGCLAVTWQALLNGQTTMDLSGSAGRICAFFALSCFLGILEAMQIAVFAVSKLPESELAHYPTASANSQLVFKGSNFKAFLTGRQICVTMSMFLLARLTTTEVKPGETVMGISDGLQFFFNTGLPGALITTIVASLFWRIVASSYPIAFLTNPTVKPTIQTCLALEASGIFSISWLLADIVRHVMDFRLDDYYLARAKLESDGSWETFSSDEETAALSDRAYSQDDMILTAYGAVAVDQ
ncbi:unnamed protein product [Cylindrotheca closterium]|uniref:Silicon transporter n=1 Tax=Cylindrotheca closterium TaxID=2856 RepID=A0AAD2CEN8_9STRA|nr:unnamed protein product [Cylindrotheca closterium]